MNSRRTLSLAIFLAVSVTAAEASTALTLGAAAGYNVFVFSDFTEYNTTVQGKMAVGGNFSPSNGGSLTIAANHGSDGAGVYDLVVGGNFLQTGNTMGGGDVFVGGNMTWNNPSLPHNAYVDGNFANNSAGGSTNGIIYYGGTYSSGDPLSHQSVSAASMVNPIDFLSAKTSLKDLSTALAGDAANGTVNHAYSTYTLTGTDASFNVFNLTDTSYSGTTINITAPSGSTVVVNVSGSSDSFSGGSINLSGVATNHVIFNFNQATSLALGGIAFNGTILAPLATFTGNYGQLNGQLIAQTAGGTTQINETMFNGSLGTVTATPEPSTKALFGLGLLSFVAFRFRRSAA